jgi:hypothetical protein
MKKTVAGQALRKNQAVVQAKLRLSGAFTSSIQEKVVYPENYVYKNNLLRAILQGWSFLKHPLGANHPDHHYFPVPQRIHYIAGTSFRRG